jgi:hypothetical protein
MSARPTDIRSIHNATAGQRPDDSYSRRGEGVTDPRDAFAKAPQYTPGKLPPIFENYVTNCIDSWGGDPGPYACAFIAMHCSVFHSSVKMQPNPTQPNVMRCPNDFSLTLGRSGQRKSGMFKDLTQAQEKWQIAMSKTASKKMGKGSKFGPMAFLQSASIEGMLHQIADNQGERLLMGSEEAMAFYGGAAAHRREDAVSAMTDTITAVYDGGVYSKRLVKEVFSIPEALATLIMTTVFEKIVGWQHFKIMVESGAMSRHTVGLVAYPRAASTTLEGIDHTAKPKMNELLLKMRGMRNMQFVLSNKAAKHWMEFRETKEADIEDEKEGGVSEGLELWCRKYDMRIMSMATILQCYEFVEGGMMGAVEKPIPLTEDDEGKVSEAKVLRVVEISEQNLLRAIDFVEGYLYDVQEFFYRVARGVTEFGPELVNWMAYRLTIRYTDRHDPVLSRGDLTSRGPSMCRGAITPDLQATQKRWIQALIDHGFIEPYDKAGARPFKKLRADNEMPWYRIRDEFYEYFSGPKTIEWASKHDNELKAKMEARGMRIKRRQVKLPD